MKRNARKQRRAARRAAQKRRNLLAMAGAAAILLGLAGYFAWDRSTVPDVPQARLEDNPVYGPADAPVTVTEYGDFTCSACRGWHQAGVLFDLVERYEGRVRLEWRDLPIITADSPKAAEAGQCAHDQDRFWDYLDRVYNEPGPSYTNARPDDLVRYAADIGLDMPAFNACLDGRRHRATVDFDLDFARGLGLNGTPSFSVNGTRIIGGDPAAIQQAIEVELARIQ